MIEINERIEVPSAAPRVVWDLLSDPHDVVGCVPGAALGEEHEDGTFDGSLTVKFGPARVTFKARIELDLDEAAMSGRVTARGKDNQGGTRFRASMGFQVVEQQEPPGSTVLVKGENEISGKLAGIVEAGAKIVIKRMSAEFAENLAARLNGSGSQPTSE
ncbi:MAG TPA: SRPBCC family protein [Burkholderiales bacterium]|nr:SRPBCC family protein [Burkholderiales bacterium]